MKKRFSAACLILPGLAAFACSPTFPASYFNEIDHADIAGTWSAPAELKLIGEHCYPEWKGRAPEHNSVDTESAILADTAAALGTDSAPEAEAYLKFHRQCNAPSQPLPAMPENPGKLREFYLYSLGRGRYLRNPGNGTPREWEELLALPPEERHYRTVWVYFAMTLAASDFSETEKNLGKLRKALDEGFADTPALGESVLRQLVRRNRVSGLRWMPLLLAAKPADDPFVEEALRDLELWQRTDWAADFPYFYEAMTRDNTGREILTVFNPVQATGFSLREDSVLLTADRQAWRMFLQGDFETAGKLAEKAPKDSLIALFVRARLARMKGDFKTSAELLRRWLDVYAKAKTPPPAVLFRYAYRTNEYGTEPEMRNVVNGVLGTVLVEQKDFAEALRAFLDAGSWIDAAYVAEELLSTENLVKILRETPKSAFPELRYLAGRRLMREKKVSEAAEFLPDSLKKDYEAWIKLSVEANKPENTKNVRALALFNLSRLAAAKGMELFGTELEPDNFINGGAYGCSGISSFILTPPEGVRFHYRVRSLNYAVRAAALTEDPVIEEASLAFGWYVSNLLKRSPLESEVFYHLFYDRTFGNPDTFRPDRMNAIGAALRSPEILTAEQTAEILGKSGKK